MDPITYDYYVTNSLVPETVKVLIAEDEEDVLSLYSDSFKERGHDVMAARDGSECLRIYHEQFSISNSPFDAVILDYKIPKITGLEVAKEILATNRNQRIIFVSAFVKETLFDSVNSLGQLVELVQKPVDVDVLANLVENPKPINKLRDITRIAKRIGSGGKSLTDGEVDDLLKTLRESGE